MQGYILYNMVSIVKVESKAFCRKDVTKIFSCGIFFPCKPGYCDIVIIAEQVLGALNGDEKHFSSSF